MTMLYKDYLEKMAGCPFCVPHETKRALADRGHAYLTYALAPYRPHHLLVIPRRHIVSYFDINSEERKEFDELIVLGTTILKKLGHLNFSILVREGGGSEKSIAHVHYHLIPDIHLGDMKHSAPRVMLEDKEIEVLRESILQLSL